MKTSLLLLISLILIAFQPIKAQNIEPIRVIDLGEKPVSFSVDPFGAVYVNLQNGSLQKYDTLGKATSLPGRRSRSSFWSVDASNPFKIILFNRDLQQADIISSGFSKTSSYDLNQLEAGDISLFCSSYDNAFWALTNENLTLIRYNEQWAATSQTNTRLLIGVEAFEPNILTESNRRILLAQRKGHAYIFDVFGNMLFHFPDSALNYATDNEVLYYLKNDSIHAYQTILHEKAFLPFNLNHIDDFAFSSPWFALLQDNKIFIFRKP